MTENPKPQGRFPAWVRWLTAGLCLLPPVALAVLLRQNAVNVPYWDEWDDGFGGLFLKWHAGTLNFGDFWAQHNESRLVLPRVIFLLLGGFSHWNLLPEVVCTFLLACGVAAMVFHLCRKTLAGRPLAAGLACFIGSLLVFSPAQHEAWLWGMELILYLPLLFILASLLVLRTGLAWRTKLVVCGAFATASTYSFSNGLLAWIALFPVLFLAGGRAGLRIKSRAALLWGFAFIANVALYFQDYQFPESPGLWQVLCADPWLVAKYFCAFLGGPLASQNSGHQVTVGILAGGVQFALFATVCLMIFRRRKDSTLMNHVWPWLTLGGYGILSALLATSGRAAFGAPQALSSRYGIFGICLTVALACLMPLVTSRRLVPALFGAMVIGLHALAFPAAVVNMTVFSLDLRHAKACLKFLDALPPQPATRTTLCPSYPKVKAMADALDRAGVWDYSLHQTRRLADFKQSPPPAGQAGGVENCQVIGTNLFLAGWARSAARPAAADCVLFTSESEGVEPQIFGLMDRRFVRADLVEKFHDQAYLLAGWQKTCPLANLPRGALTIKAWSYDVETSCLMPLANEAHLDNR
jgi:hypothetical protein